MQLSRQTQTNTVTITNPESHPSTWKLYTCMTSPTRIPCHDVRCLAAKSALMRRRQSLFLLAVRVKTDVETQQLFGVIYLCTSPFVIDLSLGLFHVYECGRVLLGVKG